MEWVYLDMRDPFPNSNTGNKYILVMVDQYSKWVEIQPLKDISAEPTAHTAVNHFFTKFSYPLLIHTDQGKNFDGSLFQEMCKLLQITEACTTPYWSCLNGKVEWHNRLLLQLIGCYIQN